MKFGVPLLWVARASSEFYIFGFFFALMPLVGLFETPQAAARFHLPTWCLRNKNETMHLPFRLALGLSLALGSASAAVAQETTRPPAAQGSVRFPFEGPFGPYHRGAAAARASRSTRKSAGPVHALSHVAFHNLSNRAHVTRPRPKPSLPATRCGQPNDKGETTDEGERLTRPGIIADYFPWAFANENAARAANNGNLPPDLSMIVKARRGGAHYVYSIVTGFHQTPPKGFTVVKDKYYNPYFDGWNIGMPPPWPILRHLFRRHQGDGGPGSP